MIGDNLQWSKPEFDDAGWDEIETSSPWEDQSFPGYNGYTWYRKTISISPDKRRGTLVLALGRIDDVDEVYFNGIKIGSTGGFPPNYRTAYHLWRKYVVPVSIINFSGNNVIAVRVFDGELAGGMIEGRIGLITPAFDNPLPINYYLDGYWKFVAADSREFSKPDYKDGHWKDLMVPGKWEEQGYENHDGFGWYRKKFVLPANLRKQDLVLVLGKIDDLDEVYLNGILIGKTGTIRSNPDESYANNEYRQLRGYYIPEKALNRTGENVIAVRVYDKMFDGGIYEGPIGIITQTAYIDYWNNVNKR